MSATRELCKRVTGYALEPHYWHLEPERRGPQREKPISVPGRVGRPETRLAVAYDVLCGSPATFRVQQGLGLVHYCCTRCLPDLVDDGLLYQVERYPNITPEESQ